MALPPSLTLMANAMKYEKEIFWIHHKDLSDDERQRRWTVHTAELTSLLEKAPVESLDFEVGVADQTQRQQHAAVNLPVQLPLTQPHSVMATTPLMAFRRLTLV